MKWVQRLTGVPIVAKMTAASRQFLVVTEGRMNSESLGLKSPLMARAIGAMKPDPLPFNTPMDTGMRTGEFWKALEPSPKPPNTFLTLQRKKCM